MSSVPVNRNYDQTECPLCMEPFEDDDVNFFPCACGYQICRFCWHRIRTDENGLCPACRRVYTEDPATFKPLSKEEFAMIKAAKRQKNQQKKQKVTENRKSLNNVRVMQKNLVFVLGLPARLADAEVLKKHEYFGKFGKITKVVINQSSGYAGTQNHCASAYVTYSKTDEALRAIQAVNSISVDGRTLKASLGTTKYCSHFMKNHTCMKTDCMYLHELGDQDASFTREDMQAGKHQDFERRLHEQLIISMQQQLQNQKSTSSSSEQIGQFDSFSNLMPLKESWPSLHSNSPSPSSTPNSSDDTDTSGGTLDTNRLDRKKNTVRSTSKTLETCNSNGTNNNSNSATINNNNKRPNNAKLNKKRQPQERKNKEAIGSKIKGNNNNNSDSDLRNNNNNIWNEIDTDNNSVVIKDKKINNNDNSNLMMMATAMNGKNELNEYDDNNEDMNNDVASFGIIHNDITANGFVTADNTEEERNIDKCESPVISQTTSININRHNSNSHSFFSCNGTNDIMEPSTSGQEDWREELQIPEVLPIIPDVLPTTVHTSENWQAAFGFTDNNQQESKSKDNKIRVRKDVKDDLGFDPFAETQKALAEMIEKEKQINGRMDTRYNSNDGYSNLINNHNNNHLNNTQNNIYQKRLLAMHHNSKLASCTKLLEEIRLGNVITPRTHQPPPGFTNTSTQMNSFGIGIPRTGNSKTTQHTTPQSISFQQNQMTPASWDWSTLDPAIVAATAQHCADLYTSRQPPPGFPAIDNRFVFNNYV